MRSRAPALLHLPNETLLAIMARIPFHRNALKPLSLVCRQLHALFRLHRHRILDDMVKLQYPYTSILWPPETTHITTSELTGIHQPVTESVNRIIDRVTTAPPPRFPARLAMPLPNTVDSRCLGTLRAGLYLLELQSRYRYVQQHLPGCRLAQIFQHSSTDIAIRYASRCVLEAARAIMIEHKSFPNARQVDLVEILCHESLTLAFEGSVISRGAGLAFASVLLDIPGSVSGGLNPRFVLDPQTACASLTTWFGYMENNFGVFEELLNGPIIGNVPQLDLDPQVILDELDLVLFGGYSVGSDGRYLRLFRSAMVSTIENLGGCCSAMPIRDFIVPSLMQQYSRMTQNLRADQVLQAMSQRSEPMAHSSVVNLEVDE